MYLQVLEFEFGKFDFKLNTLLHSHIVVYTTFFPRHVLNDNTVASSTSWGSMTVSCVQHLLAPQYLRRQLNLQGLPTH